MVHSFPLLAVIASDTNSSIEILPNINEGRWLRRQILFLDTGHDESRIELIISKISC